jgi:hypothetical protein
VSPPAPAGPRGGSGRSRSSPRRAPPVAPPFLPSFCDSVRAREERVVVLPSLP